MENNFIQWDLDLIKRYDLSGPRYTSYPTAVQFDPSLTASDLISYSQKTANISDPLSLYVHIPFCEHVCYYCACNKIITRNRKKAQPYLDTVYSEMAFLAESYSNDRVVTQLHWGGGTPTFISHEQMIELMGKMREHFNLLDDDSGDYSIEIDPREASLETLKVLRDIGFNRISLGLQDIDPKVQEAVNRIQSVEQTNELLQEARRLGFRSLNLDLIYGLPFQTLEGFNATLDKVIEMNPDRLSVFNYAHLPDRFRPQRHIQTDALPSAETKLAILESTIKKLLAAGYVYIGMDHFAKPDDELAIAQRTGKLHRNFQGYTTHAECDLIAMGVSAISQVGDVYYQNQHEIKAYTDAVDENQNAVFRGVTLTQDDIIRRHVITQLICHFELDIQSVAAKFSINFAEYFADAISELSNFAEDGLIKYDSKHIEVTPAGRLLIRRICMAFDAYIPKSAEQNRFSRII